MSKPMKHQTVEDFPVGTRVWISFTDLGTVVGSVKVDEYPDALLVVHLLEKQQNTNGMSYQVVCVHPSNITHDVRNHVPSLVGWMA